MTFNADRRRVGSYVDAVKLEKGDNMSRDVAVSLELSRSLWLIINPDQMPNAHYTADEYRNALCAYIVRDEKPSGITARTGVSAKTLQRAKAAFIDQPINKINSEL